jgi:hypothetical protein
METLTSSVTSNGLPANVDKSLRANWGSQTERSGLAQADVKETDQNLMTGQVYPEKGSIDIKQK